MHVVAVPLLGIIFNILLQDIKANLALDFRVTKITASHKPANCNVANTTYAHGETFKLDCKTQCVCENGRHACSSLCPKEQLPAPEDTISCRSPRLVEVPGHCCKMWLCENPTADVYATCHNSSTSPWTPCSRKCGLGISTRFTTTTAGCNQLSNLRLCENRKCETQQPLADWNKAKQQSDEQKDKDNEEIEKKYEENDEYLMKTKQKLKNKFKRPKPQQEKHEHYKNKHQPMQQQHSKPEHRIRKGHECRSIQRLGPARIRLGECVSKKLYRPKICGRCHQNTKCCVPSVSTTIQVELLCPLNAMDPISYVQQQLTTTGQQEKTQLYYHQSDDTSASVSSSATAAATTVTMSSALATSLWDTNSLDAIDQEYLQSHQIQIENKFIAVEWILKCECTINNNCQRIVNTTDNSSSRKVGNSQNHKYLEFNYNKNVGNNKDIQQNINYLKFKRNNSNSSNHKHEIYKQQTTAALRHIHKITDDNVDSNNNNKHNMQLWSDEKENHNDDSNSDAKVDVDNDSSIYINNNNNNNIYSSHRHDKLRAKAKTIINSARNNNGHSTYSHSHSHSHIHKKQTRDYDGIYKIRNVNDNDNNYNINNYNDNENDENINEFKKYSTNADNENEQEKHQQKINVVEKEWSPSVSASLLANDDAAESVASTSLSSSSSSSDEVQPDIIPDPSPPFSANKRANNNKKQKSNFNSKDNNSKPITQTNWLQEKFKLQHEQQQQQHDEHKHYGQWLVKQNSSNKKNIPYKTHKEMSNTAT